MHRFLMIAGEVINFRNGFNVLGRRTRDGVSKNSH